MTQHYSPFLTPAPLATPNVLALLSLKRDQTIPTVLRAATGDNDSIEEHITNTRFGSFPHSTLVNQPWGSQVVASNVGARERRRGKKRKRGDADHDHAGGANGKKREDHEDEPEDEQVTFAAASSGFAHLVPPTPESWTMSLPHRTQVVYTPDYSYVLQRLRARPGDHIIEAGAGSGSFTHAAARAVFNGYPDEEDSAERSAQLGKVYSFEYHEPRFVALREEVKEHGLDGIVTVTHRDVYEDGFSISAEGAEHKQRATAVFLDLPAPWQALPHLSRSSPNSPLHHDRAVLLCSFSPCIEQAIRAANTMRELGWVDVSMAAMHHKRLDVRRERIGLAEEGTRGVTAVPGTVQEALRRLRDLEDKTQIYHEARRKHADKIKQAQSDDADAANGAATDSAQDVDVDGGVPLSAAAVESTAAPINSAAITADQETSRDRKLYKEGRLVHRTEPDLKTHTSYLLFGTLPPQWTDADEERCVQEQE